MSDFAHQPHFQPISPPTPFRPEIYATGTHPYDGSKVEVARTPEEKQTQRSFFFWYKPEMRTALRHTLNKLGLKHIATRLLDERQQTTDVTPPPHITPCGGDARKEPPPAPSRGFFQKGHGRK